MAPRVRHVAASHAAKVVHDDVETVSPIDAETIERKLAWQHGMLEFVNAPLGDVIAGVGRYTDKRFEIADPEPNGLSGCGDFQHRRAERQACLRKSSCYLECLPIGVFLRLTRATVPSFPILWGFFDMTRLYVLKTGGSTMLNLKNPKLLSRAPTSLELSRMHITTVVAFVVCCLHAFEPSSADSDIVTFNIPSQTQPGAPDTFARQTKVELAFAHTVSVRL